MRTAWRNATERGVRLARRVAQLELLRSGGGNRVSAALARSSPRLPAQSALRTAAASWPASAWRCAAKPDARLPPSSRARSLARRVCSTRWARSGESPRSSASAIAASTRAASPRNIAWMVGSACSSAIAVSSSRIRSASSSSTPNASIARPCARWRPSRVCCSVVIASVSAGTSASSRDGCRASVGQSRVDLGQRHALRPVALQRPRRQRERGQQQATSEDQYGAAERMVERGRRGSGDHQQDHAGHADPRGIGAEHHQQAAEKAAGRGGDQDRQQLAADQEAHQRGESGRQRRQQQLPHALAIRPGLIGEHRVQRAGGHAQADLRMAGCQAHRQRQHHRRGIAQHHPPRHVRPLDGGQAFDRMGA